MVCSGGRQTDEACFWRARGRRQEVEMLRHDLGNHPPLLLFPQCTPANTLQGKSVTGIAVLSFSGFLYKCTLPQLTAATEAKIATA